MIRFLFALLTLSPLSAQAAWTSLISCENSGMVVDRGTQGEGYQLVIRNNPGILRYFSTRADISRAVNEKGELIVTVSPGGPGVNEAEASSLYTGYISGETNVVISRLDESTIKVGVWEVGYRSTHNEEVANWIFHSCSFR